MIADPGVLTIPAEWRWPPQAAVFVGGCVKRGIGSSFRATAHAHNYATDPHFGWICVRGKRRVFAPSGAPSYTLLHELAHVLTPNQKHTHRWVRTARGLGVPEHIMRREAAALRMTMTPNLANALANGSPHRRVVAPAVTYTRA